MKNIIYLVIATFLVTSCNISKEIYDDVYDNAEVSAPIKVDEKKGYEDYIKEEEHKYTVVPEQEHYSYINNSSRDNQFNSNNHQQYYCYYHREIHTHFFDDPQCESTLYAYQHNQFGCNNQSGFNNYYSNYNGFSGFNTYCNNNNNMGFNNYAYNNNFGYSNLYGYGYNPYNYTTLLFFSRTTLHISLTQQIQT